MRYILLATVIFSLTACKYEIEDKDMIKACVSNQGRPTLYMDTNQATLSGGINGPEFVHFRELCTDRNYSLHVIEDRDYNCQTTVKEPICE